MAVTSDSRAVSSEYLSSFSSSSRAHLVISAAVPVAACPVEALVRAADIFAEIAECAVGGHVLTSLSGHVKAPPDNRLYSGAQFGNLAQDVP